MNLNDLTNWYDFRNKTIIITGGTGVLGGEMACALVGCGANVVVLDRNPDLPEELQRPLDAGPGKYLLVYGYVLQKDSLLTAANTIREHFGRIDALINAAGGNHPQATTGADNAFFDIPQEALNFVLDLNLVGTILPSQVFGKLMAEQGDGIILNVSSMSALTPITRVPAYSAAKGSVNNFTQWLAVYMAQEYSAHIRVNAVAPGFFLTKQNRFLLTDEESGKLTKRGQQCWRHPPGGSRVVSCFYQAISGGLVVTNSAGGILPEVHEWLAVFIRQSPGGLVVTNSAGGILPEVHEWLAVFCHFTPYTVPVINGQNVPPVYGQSVPPINGQDVPLSTSLHPPTILPAKYENKPEGTWQEKGKRSWTFMRFYNICGPGTVTDVSNGIWASTAGPHRNIENGLKNTAC